MANIKKRGNKYTYTYDDPNQPYYTDPKTSKTRRKQVYASFDTELEAEIFKAELEVKKLKGTAISPTTETLADFIPRWIAVYAPGNWQPKTYDSSVGLLNNHVISELGHYKLQKITPFIIESFITRLRKKKCSGPKSYNKAEAEIPCLSSTTVRHVYDLLMKIFDKAVEWHIIEDNPVKCERPKKAKNKRKAWSKNEMRAALEDIQKPLLRLSVHTAFFCSLRNGETMGITMDCIDFDDGDFGSIVVNKTLQRVSKKALEEIPPDELMFVFPEQQDGKKSVLILKQPKTEGSCRKVYLTRKNRELILERLEEIKREKEFFGDAYHDFSLLFALPQGWPIEPKLNEKWFKKWQQGSPLELPEVVFHEIRHTSITYKVLVSGGDIKNVGLGAGQTNVQTTEGYNHGFDERQREIARQVENDFWSDGGIDGDQPLEDVRSISLIELQEIIEERTGQEMKSSYEFETSTEYVEYLLDELIKRKSPLAKAPSLALVAHDASPAKRRIVSNL